MAAPCYKTMLENREPINSISVFSAAGHNQLRTEATRHPLDEDHDVIFIIDN